MGRRNTANGCQRLTFICRSTFNNYSFGRSHRATFVWHVSAQVSSPRRGLSQSSPRWAGDYGVSDGLGAWGRRSARFFDPSPELGLARAWGFHPVHIRQPKGANHAAAVMQDWASSRASVSQSPLLI